MCCDVASGSRSKCFPAYRYLSSFKGPIQSGACPPRARSDICLVASLKDPLVFDIVIECIQYLDWSMHDCVTVIAIRWCSRSSEVVNAKLFPLRFPMSHKTVIWWSTEVHLQHDSNAFELVYPYHLNFLVQVSDRFILQCKELGHWNASMRVLCLKSWTHLTRKGGECWGFITCSSPTSLRCTSLLDAVHRISFRSRMSDGEVSPLVMRYKFQYAPESCCGWLVESGDLYVGGVWRFLLIHAHSLARTVHYQEHATPFLLAIILRTRITLGTGFEWAKTLVFENIISQQINIRGHGNIEVAHDLTYKCFNADWETCLSAEMLWLQWVW